MITTIHEASQRIKSRDITPVDLVEQCFRQMDLWEEKVRAWVFVDRENALAEAKRLTEELQKGLHRGPLHGIPLGIKDIFDVADWPTAAGYGPWKDAIAREDAPLIRALRHAGAIFLGKTVTTQFASFDPPVTRNPWSLDRTPGGSSSGSAAAVATLMCLGAMGSQTGGSITRPASFCGTCGLKPTYGITNLKGIVPLAPAMDHPGPIGRCPIDLAILHQIIVDPSFFDRSNLDDDSPDSDERPTFFRMRGMFHDHADLAMQGAMDALCEDLSLAGAEVIDANLPAEFAEILLHHRVIMATQAAEFHEARFRKHPETYGPRIRSLVEEGLATPAPAYARALDYKSRLWKRMADYLDDDRVLLMPATVGPAPSTDTTGNPAFNSPWSLLGLPTVSFPLGTYDEGLPLCVQLAGPALRDFDLVRSARWIESQALEIALGKTIPNLPQ